MTRLARLIIVGLLISTCLAEIFHHHHNRIRRRFHHRLRNRPTVVHQRVRSERNAEECEQHEHHMMCGPERHCEKSCENMFSLPHCNNKLDHPKCYFPRCICNPGYIRDHDGKCIKPSQCPNHYFEPVSMLKPDDSNEMMIQFKPVKFARKSRISRIIKKRTNKPKPKPSDNDIMISFEPVKLARISGNVRRKHIHKPHKISVTI